MNPPANAPKRKAPSDLPGLLLGWLFIIAVLFGITLMILNSKPERRLICDDTLRRSPSLTQFGTCRRE